LSFGSFTSTRSLIRDLKERKEMKHNGEYFCNMCGGINLLKVTKKYKNLKTNKVKKHMDWARCEKCNGTGKLDWVQKVIDPRRLS
jgi:uncharacterized protein with PIN domain